MSRLAEDIPACAICGEPLNMPNILPPHTPAEVAEELEKEGILLICKACHEELGWPESTS